MDMNQPPAIVQPADQWMAGSMSFPSQGPTFFVLGGKDGELVRISMDDGSVTFGPNYNPDEAAKTFWQTVSEDYRRMLRWKAEHPEAQ